jgi:hypothetical protein
LYAPTGPHFLQSEKWKIIIILNSFFS